MFSKTAGFRHDSIPQGIAAIQALGTANGFAVDATEDAAQFTDANLAQYDVVIFLSTTGDVLDATQQAAFERYIQSGKGYVGIHAASDTEYTWPWYGQMLGGYFRNHPAGTPAATVRIEDANEPSTTGLPNPWPRTDEWYNFQPPGNPVVNGGGTDYSPRDSGVHVLATVDESTYDEDDGNTTDDDHPVAWCTNFDGGRAWYTAMGHTQSSFCEAAFRAHLLGGIRTAAGTVTADCGPQRQAPPSAGDFEIVTLDDDTESPMELAVAKDGRVFYVERITGEVNVIKPDTGQVLTAGPIPVSSVQENGCWASPWTRTSPPTTTSSSPTRRSCPNTETRDLALHGRRRHARHGLRARDPDLQQPAHGVLPLLRLAGLRARRQPLHVDRRQHQPVRLRRLQPDRRARRPRLLGRPAHVGEHQQLQRQDPAHHAAAQPDGAGRRHGLHDPDREPLRRTPTTGRCPRSSRWASATRSGSRSIPRRATC